MRNKKWIIGLFLVSTLVLSSINVEAQDLRERTYYYEILEPRHRRFLAGRFGMKIHNDALDCPGNLRQDLFHRLKRTICALLHENFAHERNDRDFAACGIAEYVPPFSRLQGAQIRGAHQIFDGKNLCFKVFLIPHVISRGQYIGNFHVFDT